MNTERTSILYRRAAFLWVAVVTALVLLAPLVAMQFTEEVNWGVADFIIMSILLFGTGSIFVLVSRRFPRRRRKVIAAALAGAFLYLWAELAVGIFTDFGS